MIPHNSPPGEEQSLPSLQRYISQSGYCSRRKAAALIAGGKVQLNGEVCSEPWRPVRPGQRVWVAGVGISGNPKRLYLALHKPPGYLSSNSDPEGRPCAIDLIQPLYHERLFHVGRLDKNSSGLLLFTNDGNFANNVQHPSRAVEKEYLVRTRKSIPEFMLEHWQRGIEIDSVRYRLRNYQMIGHREVRLVLVEGLNREIRRVFEHFHIPLKRVHRLRIGSVKLHGLAPGQFRPLKPYEQKALQSGSNPKPKGHSTTDERTRSSAPKQWYAQSNSQLRLHSKNYAARNRNANRYPDYSGQKASTRKQAGYRNRQPQTRLRQRNRATDSNYNPTHGGFDREELRASRSQISKTSNNLGKSGRRQFPRDSQVLRLTDKTIPAATDEVNRGLYNTPSRPYHKVGGKRLGSKTERSWSARGIRPSRTGNIGNSQGQKRQSGPAERFSKQQSRQRPAQGSTKSHKPPQTPRSEKRHKGASKSGSGPGRKQIGKRSRK